MPSVEIVRLLDCLDGLKDTTPVALKEENGFFTLEGGGILGKLGAGSDAAMNATLVSYLSRIVYQQCGANAADDVETELTKVAEEKKNIPAGNCRKLLLRYAISAGEAKALAEFNETMSADLLEALKFAQLSPLMQTAIMGGVSKGLESMQTITELPREDAEALTSNTMLALEQIQKAQSVIATSVKNWGNAATSALMPQKFNTDLPVVVNGVVRCYQATKSKLFCSLVETLTQGNCSDIFIVQSHVVSSYEKFAAVANLPSGIDGKEPLARYQFVQAIISEAAEWYVRRVKGLTARHLVDAAVKMLKQTDVRLSLGSLLRLHMNSILRNLPQEEQLKERGMVKGFDGEGIHEDFIRDCIAKRNPFTILGTGRLKNAVDRERAFAAGKKDLKFYEMQVGDPDEPVEQDPTAEVDTFNDDSEQERTVWEKPDVRNSVSLTPDELEEERTKLVKAVRIKGLRMALTALANHGSLQLLSIFYGKDPAVGNTFEGTHRHMEMVYDPEKLSLSVNAILFHDALSGMERKASNDGEDGGLNGFSQIRYEIFFKKRASRKDGMVRDEWRVGSVVVDRIHPFFMPPKNEDGQTL